MLVGACGDKASQVTPEQTGGSYGSGVDLDALDKPEPTTTGAKSGGSAGSNQSAGQPAPAQPAPQMLQGAAQRADDLGNTGRNALVYLRGDRYTKLVFEITAANGWEPDPESINILRSRLQQVLDKPAGIEFLPAKTFVSGRSTYSQSNINALETQHRTRFSAKEGGTAVIHMLFLNGAAADKFTGRAYRASSIVVMAEESADRETLAVSRGKIEGALLVHEVGHLLRLVNHGYTSPRDHEDPDHRGHSRNIGSVMYWQVDAAGDLIEDVFEGPPPSKFDQEDIADLADIKAGRLGPK
jgi:hypothetical protein